MFYLESIRTFVLIITHIEFYYFMKRILFIIPLLAACGTENPISPNGLCTCYKETQQKNADGSFSTTNNSEPSPDVCEKNGFIEYSNSTTYRILWHCN